MKTIKSFASPAIVIAKKIAEQDNYHFERSYRFFYHYRKETGGMTIHFRNVCYPVKDVICNVPCETKFNKTQPRLVMRGFAKEVIINGDTGIIQ